MLLLLLLLLRWWWWWWCCWKYGFRQLVLRKESSNGRISKDHFHIIVLVRLPRRAGKTRRRMQLLLWLLLLLLLLLFLLLHETQAHPTPQATIQTEPPPAVGGCDTFHHIAVSHSCIQSCVGLLPRHDAQTAHITLRQ